MEATNEQLWGLCRALATDFEPFGQRSREPLADCTGCLWFQPLLRARLPDWGVCANYESPRAGLLTFREQGCEQFKQDDDLDVTKPWTSRAEFADRVEALLTEAHGNFVEIEMCQFNEPTEQDLIWMCEREGDIARTIGVLMWQVLKRRTSFDRRQAAEETISGLKARSDLVWEVAKRNRIWFLAKTLELDGKTVEASFVMPDIRSRDDEFWRRVDTAVRDALQSTT